MDAQQRQTLAYLANACHLLRKRRTHGGQEYIRRLSIAGVYIMHGECEQALKWIGLCDVPGYQDDLIIKSP